MKYNYIVKYNGVYYEAGQDVPIMEDALDIDIPEVDVAEPKAEKTRTTKKAKTV